MNLIALLLAVSCLFGCATGIGDELEAEPVTDAAPSPARTPPAAEQERDASSYVPPPCFTYLACSCDVEGRPKARPMPAYCQWYDAQRMCEAIFTCEPR